MLAMRPRFSLKWLLIGFTVLTVAFCVLTVRPTAVANQFVRAIEEHDYKRATALLESHDKTSFATNYVDATCEPEISPREWSDLWHLRRRITVNSYVTTKYHNRRTGKTDHKTIHRQTSQFGSGPLHVRLFKREAMNFW